MSPPPVPRGRWPLGPGSASLRRSGVQCGPVDEGPVHLLPPDEFRELRLDRNRYKITIAEADRLGSLSIGIVGLSVGNAVALTLALEGSFGHLKLADHDRFELSNMNRVRAAVHDVGV